MKTSKIETGKATMRVGEVKVLLDRYGVTDRDGCCGWPATPASAAPTGCRTIHSPGRDLLPAVDTVLELKVAQCLPPTTAQG